MLRVKGTVLLVLLADAHLVHPTTPPAALACVFTCLLSSISNTPRSAIVRDTASRRTKDVQADLPRL